MISSNHAPRVIERIRYRIIRQRRKSRLERTEVEKLSGWVQLAVYYCTSSFEKFLIPCIEVTTCSSPSHFARKTQKHTTVIISEINHFLHCIILELSLLEQDLHKHSTKQSFGMRCQSRRLGENYLSTRSFGFRGVRKQMGGKFSIVRTRLALFALSGS